MVSPVQETAGKIDKCWMPQRPVTYPFSRIALFSIGFPKFGHNVTGCQIRSSQKFGESEVGAAIYKSLTTNMLQWAIEGHSHSPQNTRIILFLNMGSCPQISRRYGKLRHGSGDNQFFIGRHPYENQIRICGLSCYRSPATTRIKMQNFVAY